MLDNICPICEEMYQIWIICQDLQQTAEVEDPIIQKQSEVKLYEPLLGFSWFI